MRTAHHSVALAVLLVACSPREAQPGDPCESITDCVAEQALACTQDECRRLSCQRSATCPAGAACVSGVCALPECADDRDCVAQQRCFEGDCRADLCAFKSECERGEVCIGAPPMCRLPPVLCDGDRDCPNDTFCQKPEQLCERKCTSDASCALDTYCYEEFCRLRCSTTTDCAATDACVDGRCKPVTCPDQPCPADAPFLEPRSCTCVTCLDDSDCSISAGQRCSNEQQCLFCVLKTVEISSCTAQGLHLVEGCCAECGQDSDCEDGASCAAGRCVLNDPRECVFDEDCAVGSRCDLGFCIDPGSGTLCQRQSECAVTEACHADGRCRARSELCADCPSPGRCVAEPGDTVGSCVGCTTSCSQVGCGSQVCVLPPGAVEGFCAAPDAVDCP